MMLSDRMRIQREKRDEVLPINILDNWIPLAAQLEAELEELEIVRGKSVLVPSDKLNAMQTEITELREAAGWVLRVANNIGKHGGPPSQEECIDAMDALKKALETP